MIVLLLALAAQPAAPALPEPRARPIPSVKGAIEELLSRKPRVVAFGEFHQSTATLKVPSSLKRFEDELFEVVAPRASDLVVETWVTEGKCGKTEKAVMKDVQKTTQRPVQTEDEVVTLLKRAKGAGVQPHILKVSCKEYDALLRLPSEKLEAGVREVLGKPGAGADPRAIVVYGGALHNDLAPGEGLSSYAFGESVSRTVGGKYLEIDLFVPEYIEKQASLRKEPWFRAYQRVARSGQAVMIERSLASYVFVFPRAQRPKGKR